MAERTFLGEFELLVLLAVIRIEENAYGVPIAQEIKDRTGREVSLGSVYAVLERLEQHGLISSRVGEATAQRGGRAKRYFSATKLGIQKARETQQALMSAWRDLPQLEGCKA
jgi:PadR family transcriptional regulator, regulatory protein PadR